MKNSVELKQERASVMTAQKQLVDAAKADQNRNFSADENTKFDGFQTQIESFDKDIERAVKFEANELRNSVNGVNVNTPTIDGPAVELPFSFIRAINSAKKNKEHTGAEKRALEEGLDEIRTRGLSITEGVSVAIPSSMLIGRAQSVTGDSGTKGGEFVATSITETMPLLPSLKIQDMGAKVMSGLQGNLKLISGDQFVFSYVAENAEVSASDTVIDGVTLSPKRLSGVVDISNQWLIQTTPAAEAHIRMLIANGIQNAITAAFLNGPGGVAPTGLYTTITTNIQAGTAGAPTWEDVVGLETLIKSANATENNLYYLSDAPLMGKLKTTKKDAGSGTFLSEGGLLNGRSHIASSLVPTLDAGASHPLIYGDFGQATVGFWSGVSFIVDNLTQATKGNTRLIFNIYNDVAVANEKAFAIRKNFTI
jgi:HK97 family phage major capsid protein